ncbi:hypothetical protein FRC04_010822 [Tulasnella sp. 424]|nr:hypothetical protein FRC04_010822 [Tulasnella sp. 424]
MPQLYYQAPSNNMMPLGLEEFSLSTEPSMARAEGFKPPDLPVPNPSPTFEEVIKVPAVRRSSSREKMVEKCRCEQFAEQRAQYKINPGGTRALMVHVATACRYNRPTGAEECWKCPEPQCRHVTPRRDNVLKHYRKMHGMAAPAPIQVWKCVYCNFRPDPEREIIENHLKMAHPFW